ncbi:MAG TPA: tetratricopeptide repeat protein, partial [Myxococcota bacterium]|nr:tetratricopeptide repeat protein [Myxococcota bacterium]
MALNKRKILDAAQKYLQKGSLDKALKEYQKVLDADPKDSNVRLKVGDVQLRKGNSEAAIESYLEVARLFMKNGFDAKAVALFKQITKIDEKRYDIYEPLAELYQRLSLTSEAMQALQTAAEAHQREGRKKEGLTLLRKMASLDPSNTTTRMKVAEMLWNADLQDDALAEYDEVVTELGRQGDHENAVRVHEQVLR